MNHFQLNPQGEYAGLGETFEVIIDGKPLLALVADFERQYSTSINGSYIPALNKDDLTASLDGEAHRVMTLACNCGNWECWFFVNEVGFIDNLVYWHQWSNPYRNDKSKQAENLYWCYIDFPTLVFDKQQYQTEINRALSLCL
ncbi:hypothetical protein [Colwellia sp. MEBiC06753]